MARRWLRPTHVAFLASASLWVGSSALLARQTTGCLRVEARDSATDRLVHSRFYLTDSTGVPQTPSGAIAYDKRDEHHFVTDGEFEIALPAGPLSPYRRTRTEVPAGGRRR